MSPSASSSIPFEQQASDEVARRGLLYAEKQLLKAKQYRELIIGFRRRSKRTMGLMGLMGLMHAVFAIMYFGHAGEAENPVLQVLGERWWRPLMSAIFLAMSVVSWRDVRRCTRILASDAEADSPE